MKPYIAFATLAALAPHAVAQQGTERPHPADPAALVSAVKYESAFTSYRGFREEPLAPWRGVNDEVARVGGHVGILGGGGHGGGAQPSTSPKPPAQVSKPAAPTAGHQH